MALHLRSLVSKKKKRFKEGHFDLDLSYIRPNVIAMGFPSEGAEAIYRNPMSDVKKFLSSHHGKSFKVYNLCDERSYPAERFGGRVTRFPFPDHNPPPMAMTYDFCEDAMAYLSGGDGSRVIVVHCKAGACFKTALCRMDHVKSYSSLNVSCESIICRRLPRPFYPLNDRTKVVL